MKENFKVPIVILTITVILIPMFLVFGNLSSETDSSPNNPTTTPTPMATTAPTPSELTTPADAVTAKKVVLKTTKGDISIDLYTDITPKAAMNFATLGKRGYYNNVVFHRIVKDFMIQSGDPTGTGSGGESVFGRDFPNEDNPSHKYEAGSIGMANRGRDTNSSQFFIVTEANQPALDGGYTLFGKVADEASMQVVRTIAAVPVQVGPSGEMSQPVNVQDVKITGFNIVE